MKVFKNLILALFLCLILSTLFCAHNVWVELKAGQIYSGRDTANDFSPQLSVQDSLRHVLSLYGSLFTEDGGIGGLEAGFNYGKIFKNGVYRTIPSIGLNLLVADEDKIYPGLKATLELQGELTSWLGLQVEGFGNITTFRSWYGFQFGLILGRLR